ncbi:MAG: type II toxin-antitoxin system HicA family toxin [Bacteroidales bacterium]|nr:type II toxin-antitoxin system HicA family toxin [Bacteroidales bacterium]
MKVSELKRLLHDAGCYETRTNVRGHDEWYSPITDLRFRVPRHQSKEIAPGTLNNIKKSAGI